MTPEGKVKDAIKKGLALLGLVQTSKAADVKPNHTGKFHMPVSNGMGVHGIPDFYGHYRGRFFEIEAKAEGEGPTALQRHQLHATAVTGAASFVIDRPEGFAAFRAWARGIDNEISASASAAAVRPQGPSP